ncbi:MAG: hypothetical protein HXY42_01245 [Chloroflexi bacterium]|nr:hypothetical protein [Chloroflexota bacterium]
MITLRQLITRLKLQLRGKNRIVGWSMTPEQASAFIRGLGKTMLTFYGFSGLGYENEQEMLRIARDVLAAYSPQTTIVNIGATSVGIGAIYPLAKSMGFTTVGIVSTQALKHPEGISDAVDYICFIEDAQWGGKLPGSDELSPTSRAMVECSDILVGIGGGDISLDEMLAGHAQGKEILYFPADMNHERARRQAERRGLPPPTSFKGDAHETLSTIRKSDLQKRLKQLKDK